MDTGGRGHVVDKLQIISEYYGPNKDFNWYRYINDGIPNDYYKKWRTDRVHNIHKSVFRIFMNLMVTDIIENNVQFDFNLRNEVLLSLLIADRERRSSKYKYRIESRGHDFIPYCITSPKLVLKTKRQFLFRLHKNKWKILHKQILNGKEYDMAPTLIKKKYGF